MFFGEAPEPGPAASAVMGDVLEDCSPFADGHQANCRMHVHPTELPILSVEDLHTKYYIRFVVADRSGVLASAADIFAKYDVSVKTVTQRGNAARDDVDLVFVTHTAEERNVRKAIDDILALEGVVTGRIPVGHPRTGLTGVHAAGLAIRFSCNLKGHALWRVPFFL